MIEVGHQYDILQSSAQSESSHRETGTRLAQDIQRSAIRLSNAQKKCFDWQRVSSPDKAHGTSAPFFPDDSICCRSPKTCCSCSGRKPEDAPGAFSVLSASAETVTVRPRDLR
jgi:hypothetical protein